MNSSSDGSCSPVELIVNKLSSKFHGHSFSSDSATKSSTNTLTASGSRSSSSSSSCDSSERTVSPSSSGIVYGNTDPLEFACSPEYCHIATVAKKARERRRNSLAPRRTQSFPRPSRNAKSLELPETIESEGVMVTTLCSTEL